ncbi:MAG: FAD binding domain-containing protein [Planctomycetes bacterium]|nr:FAD binding domain-containing protein [Planctomycetota bacterium]
MMRLPPFTYRAPASVDEAVRILAGEGPSAAPVAGGTDLYPNMKRRHQTPKTLVALRGLRSLAEVRGTPEAGLRLGPGLTLTEVCEHPLVRAHYPGLARAVASISTPLLRNMGTLGGNICLDTRCTYYNQNYEWRQAINFCMKRDGEICWVAQSSPKCLAVNSSDSAPLLVALDARLRLASVRGERELPIEALYQNDGIRYLTKQPDELVTEILLPPASTDGAPGAWRATYWKLRRRGSFDFPVLGVAGCLWLDGPRVRSARLAIGGIASAPFRATETENLLAGHELTPERIDAAAKLVYRPTKPLDNTDFAVIWRKHMAEVYARRLLRELAGLPNDHGPIGAE